MGKVKKRIKQSSVERIEALHQKLLKKGLTIRQARKFDAKRWKKEFGGKKVLSKNSLKAQKKLLKQIRLHQKQVVEFSFKKRGITSKFYKDFIRDETKRIITGKEARKEKLDIKINGSVHGKQKTIDIKSRKQLKELIKDIHGSGWSPKAGAILNKSKLVKIYNVYSKFDYGEKIFV